MPAAGEAVVSLGSEAADAYLHWQQCAVEQEVKQSRQVHHCIRYTGSGEVGVEDLPVFPDALQSQEGRVDLVDIIGRKAAPEQYGQLGLHGGDQFPECGWLGSIKRGNGQIHA